MSNCGVMQFGMQKVKNVLNSSPLAPASSRNTNTTSDGFSSSCSNNKENNMEAAKTSQGWLAKVCKKLRTTRPKRLEKCEKCGQRSDTCIPNPSFISGRKHFLCQNCRASSDNMKNMYHQLCRNMSLREPRTTTSGGDASPPTSSGSSASRTAILRSRSMRTRPTAPESGYETATSVDSSCCSNGRLSPDPMSTSSGDRCGTPLQGDDLYSSSVPACFALSGQFSSPLAQSCAAQDSVMCSRDSAVCSTKDNAVCSSNRDKTEVFGGAFKSEKAHLRQIQPRPKTKVYTRPQPQQPQHPTNPPPPYKKPQHTKPNTPTQHKDNTESYDGYLKIETPNSRGVKYVFRQREEAELETLNDETQSDHLSHRRHTENRKLCYRCRNYRCVAFRAPFGEGWICEDCMDDLL